MDFKTALKKLSGHAGIQSDNGRLSVTTPKDIRILNERGISEKTAQAFRLTEGPDDLMVTHKIIFQVTGPNRNVLSYKSHKGKHLSTLRKHQEIYLLNGEPSIWRAWEAGYRNVICGTGGGGNSQTGVG